MSFFPLYLEHDFEGEMRHMREDMNKSRDSENVSHQLKRLEQSIKNVSEELKGVQTSTKDDKRLRMLESTLELTKKDVSNLGK